MGNTYKTSIDGEPAIWLQEFGYCRAKPVQDLKAGESRVYNFGTAHEIVNVELVGKMYEITVVDDKGREWSRKHRAGTLIAFREAS